MRGLSVAALAALFAAACGAGGNNMTGTNTGNGSGNGGGVANVASVGIQDYSFSPSMLQIKVGGSLAFTNYGAAAHHPVADNGGWDAGQLAPAQTGAYGMGTGTGGMASITFSTTGTFTYHCSIHPSMTGTVTVSP